MNYFSKIFVMILFIFSGCTSVRKLEKPFYYKATYQEKTYHILGTMHVGFNLTSLPDYVLKDLKKTNVVRVEATSTMFEKIELAEKDRAKEIFEHIRDPYPNLKKKFSEEAWLHMTFTLDHDDVKKYLKEIKIVHSSREVHPTMVFHLVQYFANKNADYVFHPDVLKGYSRYRYLQTLESQQSVVDKEIEAYAKDNEITVQSLDTVELLKQAHDKLYKNYFVNSLEEMFSLNSQERFNEQVQFSNAYESGDEGQLSAYLKEVKGMERGVLTNRNEHWFNVLAAEGCNDIFVAVGALHLVGEKSLLDYFKRNGATVERVSSN